MMLVITTAEASYWNLFLAQEQVRFFRDSVRLSENLVRDNREKFDAGRGSELEVLEAKAGLALRRSKLAEAEQKYFETAAQMSTLISEEATEDRALFRATDSPKGTNQVPQFAESGRFAFELNPDYLSQLKKLEQEDIRVAYAKNQRLPQLDLKASYGLNGLGSDLQSSWDDIQYAGFPSWAAGVELHIPLGGGIRVKNELDAAKLRKQQALVSLQEIEKQILNAITTSLQKIRSAQGSVQDYEEIVTFNQNLLESELSRLEVGKTDVRRVLDVEAALFEARNSVVEAKVRNERARLELELVEGTVLRSRVLEAPGSGIQRRAARFLKDAGLSEDQYQELLKYPRLTPAKPASPGSEPPPGDGLKFGPGSSPILFK
jgi:outer membrane protein TolC